MRRYFFALTFVTTLMATPVFAQHTDIEFGLDDLMSPAAIVIEVGETTATGIPFFEAEFEAGFTTEDPGFATAPDESLNVNAGDAIFARVLDSSSNALFGGLGYVTFYNPDTDSLEAATGQILLADNSGQTTDVLIDGTSLSGDNPLFVALGQIDPNTGEVAAIDDHLDFTLVAGADAPVGAYGIAFELLGSLDGTSLDNFEVTSDPFFIILNNGLSEEQFEDFAVPAFEAAAVPEPGTLGLLAMGMSCVILRRSRRRLS